MNFILQKRNQKIAICMLVLFIVIGIFAPLSEHTVYAAEEGIAEALFQGSVGKVFLWISEFLYQLSGSILAVAGFLMDFSITTSLDTNNFAKGAVENGWTILRDVANITFIFILLYIALGTILQIGTVNAKQALVNVIIIAFLINFSLFFTQVIIDASNYLATFFYNNATSITVNGTQSNLGEIFTAALGPSSLFGKDVFTSLTNTKSAASFLFATVALLLAAFSFFSVAIMFIIRTAALVLLMVLSPVAFAAYILSDTKKYFTQWFDTLLKQAFFAPIYLLVIYVVLLIIVASPFHASKQPSLAAAINTATIPFQEEPSRFTTAGAEDVITAPLGTPPDFTLASQNLAQTSQASFGTGSFIPPGAGTLAGSGSLSYLSVFFSYFLIIFLINGALVVAKTLGGQTASLGTKWAGKGLGAAIGVGAFAARRTIGRGFAALARNERFKDWAAESRVGDVLHRGTERVAGGSMDIRGGRVGSLLGAGAGAIGADFGKAEGKGGFEAIRKEQIEKKAKRGETLGRTTMTRQEINQENLLLNQLDAAEQANRVAQTNLQTAEIALRAAPFDQNLIAARGAARLIANVAQGDVRLVQDQLNQFQSTFAERTIQRRLALARQTREQGYGPLMPLEARREAAERIRRGLSPEERLLRDLGQHLQRQQQQASGQAGGGGGQAGGGGGQAGGGGGTP